MKRWSYYAQELASIINEFIVHEQHGRGLDRRSCLGRVCCCSSCWRVLDGTDTLRVLVCLGVRLGLGLSDKTFF